MTAETGEAVRADESVRGDEFYSGDGLKFRRVYTAKGKNPLDEVSYTKRTASVPLRGKPGEFEFYMEDVEAPADWSQTAVDILASKYFRKAGVPGTGTEKSARQVMDRVASHIRSWGEQNGYFASAEDANVFQDELSHLLINQKGAFNSPVWFNVGLAHRYGIAGKPSGNWVYDKETGEIIPAKDSYSRPQGSACFIQSVGDSLESITDLLKTETRLFKYGSGTGTNFSSLRARAEKLSAGGTSSGMMSWLAPLDANAGATKSGGTTRRAAKMVIVNYDHPEIKDFIVWKRDGERKVKILRAAGYDTDFEGDAYRSVGGQNSNNSVRVPDEFMQGINDENAFFETRNRTDGKVRERIKNKDLMQLISEAAWESADPGMQYDTTINRWHTCKNSGRINASNPCSEYMFLDDSACNLASINLVKFLKRSPEGKLYFDVPEFKHAVRVFFTAQEIIAGLSSYPTPKIARTSEDYRSLGLGYANLGATAMIMGLPYDSEEARSLAGSITSIMTGEAYAHSARVAGTKIGPFNEFEKNRDSFLEVMRMHRDAVSRIPRVKGLEGLVDEAAKTWGEAITLGEQNGYRNAQATVLAPTGTIGLLMDCDTTGVEPDYTLRKYKKLAGGGHMTILNKSVPAALSNLGYSAEQIAEIGVYIAGHGQDRIGELPLIKREHVSELAKSKKLWDKMKTNSDEIEEEGDLRRLGYASEEQQREIRIFLEGKNTVEGAPHVRKEHYAVFDTANKSEYGKRIISPMGHIGMMAAAQPFISGAISKTVNLPESASIEEVRNIYVEGWRRGLKAIALYRDNCKFSQPLNASSSEKEGELEKVLQWGAKRARPMRRQGLMHELTIGGQKLFLRTGEYDDGTLAEFFIDMFKEGAAYRGMLNSFAISTSNGIQHGWSLEDVADTFIGSKFEPAGIVTGHQYVKMASSVPDLVLRILGLEYLGKEGCASGNITVDRSNLRVEQNRINREMIKLREAIRGNEELRVLLENGGYLLPQLKPDGSESAQTQEHKELRELQKLQEKKDGNATATALAVAAKQKKLGKFNGEICPKDGGLLIPTGTCKVCSICGDTTGCS